MSANAAAAKKQKPLKRHPSKLKKMSAYAILAIILISILAVLFAFPLYWIITGSFKTGAAINSTTPVWWPDKWVLTNYQKLFAGKSAPLWQLAVPFGSHFSADGEPIYFLVGPTVPAAIRWMVNTVFMAVMSMILT
nr:carbohydrate ABC transporter permease [Faecalibacterium sp.]